MLDYYFLVDLSSWKKKIAEEKHVDFDEKPEVDETIEVKFFDYSNVLVTRKPSPGL